MEEFYLIFLNQLSIILFKNMKIELKKSVSLDLERLRVVELKKNKGRERNEVSRRYSDKRDKKTFGN